MPKMISINRAFLRHLISQHTKLSTRHLTPELQLHLITPINHLWRAGQDSSPFDDPFWAFYWPGGQALTRYILDNPSLFKNKTVLDVGSGCGSAAIATSLVGASLSVANDIDPAAAVAIEMNTEVNLSSVEIDTANHLNKPIADRFDVILLGDMFYDPDFTQNVHDWLKTAALSTAVFIGDPGRLSFTNHPIKQTLECAATYDLPRECQLENNGLTNASVWRLIKSR